VVTYFRVLTFLGQTITGSPIHIRLGYICVCVFQHGVSQVLKYTTVLLTFRMREEILNIRTENIYKILYKNVQLIPC